MASDPKASSTHSAKIALYIRGSDAFNKIIEEQDRFLMFLVSPDDFQ